MSRRLSRREFLALAGGTAAVLALDACRSETPTPAPTVATTNTPSPTATSAATATATHAPPAPTAAPEETATPRPEPTPTPSPTPFPPGPPSKLGVFVSRNEPSLLDLLATGGVAVVKTLEVDPTFLADIKAASPQVLVIARDAALETPDLGNWDPLDAARRWVDRLLPIATTPERLATIDAWESLNEPVPADAAQMASLAIFEAERTRLLAAAGVRSCVGNFSTGQPGLELWPAFFPALEAAQAANGFLGLHEYSAPYVWFGSGPHQLQAGSDEKDEGWLTLRYRKAYRQHLQPAGLALPLVITETGIDGQVGNRPGPPGLGWKDFVPYWQSEGKVTTTGEGFYVEQLAWYDAELAKDDYVQGATIYALVAQQGWQSFEIIGPAAAVLAQYLAVHPRAAAG